MKIIRMEVGALGTNCYLVYCEDTLEAAVIDPGGSPTKVITEIHNRGVQVVAIINTHGHADHIAADSKVQEATGAPVMIHSEDAGMLLNPNRNLSLYIGENVTLKPADRILAQGDIIPIGKFSFKVLHTPGHTPGGICLLSDNVVFSGDTLFAESVGRSDFPGGSHSQLIHSIKEKILILSDDIKVYPGHGSDTTIGWEKKMNPFIQ